MHIKKYNINTNKNREENKLFFSLFFYNRVYCFFIFGFDTRDAIYPKNTAAEIPPAAAAVPPVNAPTRPIS